MVLVQNYLHQYRYYGRCGILRCPKGRLATGSKECFVDELAYELHKDPLDYRIELLSNEVDMPDWAIK